MARESRRKRDLKRFGEGSRLCDLIHSAKWIPPFHASATQPSESDVMAWESLNAILKRFTLSLPIIDITNVHQYMAETCKPDPLNPSDEIWRMEDIPRIAPPYEAFVTEMSPIPGVHGVPSGSMLQTIAGVTHHGFVVLSEEKCDFPSVKDFFVERHTELYGRSAMDGAKQLYCLCFLYGKERNCTTGVVSTTNITYSSDGLIIGASSCVLFAPLLQSNPNLDLFTLIAEEVENATYPLMLAMAFLNCKNVPIVEVRPDEEQNRERRRHNRIPLVRYNIIDIEHPKQILRREGKSDVVGLKKALHACRGHFATYTAERPLFGKHVGTFWVPPHMRGDVKEGIVISDYNVNPQ